LKYPEEPGGASDSPKRMKTAANRGENAHAGRRSYAAAAPGDKGEDAGEDANLAAQSGCDRGCDVPSPSVAAVPPGRSTRLACCFR
jgi:hypothetical protein